MTAQLITHEAPWLMAKVDQRIAEMKAAITRTEAVKLVGADILVTPLTEPREHATRQQMQMWENTCDNCGTFVITGLPTIAYVEREWDGLPVYVFFGSCANCPAGTS